MKLISDQICIDFSAENGRKLLVVTAKACCNALFVITEWDNCESYQKWCCNLNSLSLFSN